ncbi:MAG: ATP-binding protein [Bacteroidota bacterium]
MNQYITRNDEKSILKLATFFPAVAVVGPRQVGKTSLVKAIRSQLTKPSIYLDLENPSDLAKLTNPSLFLTPYENYTVILDEVQKVPALFPVLRGIIDQNRQAGRFILLGSASPDLIRDISETLAGRIAYLELRPFALEEVSQQVDFRAHWLRGGFPEALLAPDDTLSNLWRQNFITTYLERDLPMLGLSANPILTRRLWQMTAHLSGQLLNKNTLGNSLGIHSTTVNNYLDFMEAAYLVRRLPPYYTNLKKRLVKTPKIYLRDTGILHQLIGIGSFADLSGHPIVGASWENYVVEQISAHLPDWADLYFYRTHDGTEADLVITKGGLPEILVEIKYTTTSKVSKGFYIAQADLRTKRHFVVCPVEEGYWLNEQVRVVGLKEMKQLFGE